jgi:hypothetical protein
MAPFVEIERFPGGVEFGKLLRAGQKIEKCGKSVEIISDAEGCNSLVVNGKVIDTNALAFDENTGIVYLTAQENGRRNDKYKPQFLQDQMLDIRIRWEKSVGLKPRAKLTPRSIAKSLLGMLP